MKNKIKLLIFDKLKHFLLLDKNPMLIRISVIYEESVASIDIDQSEIEKYLLKIGEKNGR